MPITVFGSGQLIGIPAPTSAAPNPTPRPFGVLQDVSIEETYEEKPLYGPYKAPIAIGQGKQKISVKAKFAALDPVQTALIFSQANVTQNVSVGFVFGEIFVGASATYTSLLPAGHATPIVDLGMSYTAASGGLPTPLTYVPSAPAAGQYTVNLATGVYTFNTADNGKSLQVSYTYTLATGSTSVTPNTLLGTTPSFSMYLNRLNPLVPGQSTTRYFGKCIATKLAQATKQDDWQIPEMDISVFADGSGNIYTDYLSS